MTVKTLTQVVFFSAELGDFNPDEHQDGYLNGFMFVPNQTREFEQQVAEKHRQHRQVIGEQGSVKDLSMSGNPTL